MLANALAHATYNQLSFQVLSRVSASSHAVLNIARRLLLIVFTVGVFRTPMDLFNWAGVALAIGGVLLFAREKGRRQHQGGSALPSVLSRDGSTEAVARKDENV